MQKPLSCKDRHMAQRRFLTSMSLDARSQTASALPRREKKARVAPRISRPLATFGLILALLACALGSPHAVCAKTSSAVKAAAGSHFIKNNGAMKRFAKTKPAPKKSKPSAIPSPPSQPGSPSPSSAPSQQDNSSAKSKLAPFPPPDTKSPPPMLPQASRERMRECADEWSRMKKEARGPLPLWRNFASKCLTR